jgi:TonB family protein
MSSLRLLLMAGLPVLGATACLQPPEGPPANANAATAVEAASSSNRRGDIPSAPGFHYSDETEDESAGHAAFFNRVHRRVSEHWYADDAYRKHDPAGPLFGACDHHATELIVEVANTGGLRSVELLRSCGLDFLDQEAIAAVQSAAPFERPPLDLVEAQGFVRFRFNIVFESQPEAPAREARVTQ